MFNVKTFLRHAVAAVALAATTLAAHALPIYHVTVNANGIAAGNPGYVDLTLGGAPGAAQAVATISNLQGNFTGVDAFSFGYTEPDVGSFALSSLVSNYLSFNVILGGSFGFDLAFSGDFLTTYDPIAYISELNVILYDADLMQLGFLTFQATQLSDFGAGNVAALPGGVLIGADVAAQVPEPSDLLLMMSGLGILGFMRRRKATTA